MSNQSESNSAGQEFNPLFKWRTVRVDQRGLEHATQHHLAGNINLIVFSVGDEFELHPASGQLRIIAVDDQLANGTPGPEQAGVFNVGSDNPVTLNESACASRFNGERRGFKRAGFEREGSVRQYSDGSGESVGLINANVDWDDHVNRSIRQAPVAPVGRHEPTAASGPDVAAGWVAGGYGDHSKIAEHRATIIGHSRARYVPESDKDASGIEKLRVVAPATSMPSFCH